MIRTSTAASFWPTSTLTPSSCIDDRVMVLANDDTVWPGPYGTSRWTPSISWTASPAILATTWSWTIVLPSSPRKTEAPGTSAVLSPSLVETMEVSVLVLVAIGVECWRTRGARASGTLWSGRSGPAGAGARGYCRRRARQAAATSTPPANADRTTAPRGRADRREQGDEHGRAEPDRHGHDAEGEPGERAR